MVALLFVFNLFRVLDNHKKYSRTNFLSVWKLLTLPPAPFSNTKDNANGFFYKKLALTQTAQKFLNEIQK